MSTTTLTEAKVKTLESTVEDLRQRFSRLNQAVVFMATHPLGDQDPVAYAAQVQTLINGDESPAPAESLPPAEPSPTG